VSEGGDSSSVSVTWECEVAEMVRQAELLVGVVVDGNPELQVRFSTDREGQAKVVVI
jgi:hypothetical protein